MRGARYRLVAGAGNRGRQGAHQGRRAADLVLGAADDDDGSFGHELHRLRRWFHERIPPRRGAPPGRARLATGRVHAVPTKAVCALTKSEREAELLAIADLSFFVDFYRLESPAGLGAAVQAIMAIEFAIEEAVT